MAKESRRGVLQDVMQRAAVMRVSEFGRAMIAAAALTVVLGGCASTPQPSQSHQTITMPSMRAAASTSAPRAPHTFSYYAVLRHIGHAVVSGVSWLFRPPTGVIRAAGKDRVQQREDMEERHGNAGLLVQMRQSSTQ